MRVLLVDDEPVLADVITASLEAACLDVQWVSDLAGARRALLSARFDLVLLDLHLPDGDGRVLLSEAARLPPVIVLSAQGDENVVIELLELGARDYIQKPFRTGELLARLRSALREPGARLPGTLTIQFDAPAQCVFVGKQRFSLSRLECRLLAGLLTQPERPVTYEQLNHAIWDEPRRDNISLRVLVGQLRQKIEPDADVPIIIQSDRGIGYRICVHPALPADS